MSDAVKIHTTIAQPFVVAGTAFTLTTTVTNAHPNDIELLGFTYHIPYQVQWVDEAAFIKSYQEYGAKKPVVKFFTRPRWRASLAPPGTPMTAGNLANPGAPVLTIPPCDTGSYSFKAMVPRWLFASSAELTFQGRLSYRHGGVIHSSEFHVTFPLHAPLRANVIGATIGSLLGSIAHELRDKGTLEVSPALLSGIVLTTILSVIAVVFSSRRTKDVQPILTVVDFWGGLVVGFLLGYLGHKFFEKLVPVASPGGG